MSLSNKNSSESRRPHVIVITGPTASGKSQLALQVAEMLGCHIISADSRQIYKGIPITTAAPTEDDLRRVPHHLVGFLELDRYYSAASFQSDAQRLIDEAGARGNRQIVICGGSMLYVDALLYGLDSLPTIDRSIRDRVKDIFADSGLGGVRAVLGNLDPDYEKFVDIQNPRRVMHAAELCLQSGKPLAELLKGRNDKASVLTFSKYVIERPRQEMFFRINRRVEMMVQAGMEEEARNLYPLRHLNSLNTIGFKEWFAHFDGKMDRATTIARIAKNTRVYAKKQLTWLARQNDITYVNEKNALDLIVSQN